MLCDPSNLTNTFQTVNAGGTKAFLFCPTYRIGGPANEVTLRNTSDVYMKGYRELLSVTPNSGINWKWRRIVFETKGTRPDPAGVSILTSDGYKRLWKLLPDATFAGITDSLFEGKENKDWSNSFMGKVDTNNYTVRYDKTVVLKSGNDNAHEHNFRHYFPFNRRFVYDDDENGLSEDNRGWAVQGKAGMGDVFILDYFVDVGGVTPGGEEPGDVLYLRSQSTLYWHEK